MQPLPRTDVTLAGSSSESSLPGYYSWKEKDAPSEQRTHGVPPAPSTNDRRGWMLGCPRGPSAMDGQVFKSWARRATTCRCHNGGQSPHRAEGMAERGCGKFGEDVQPGN